LTEKNLKIKREQLCN